MANLEDDLKLQNWLSIATFDIFKYIKAGGDVLVRQTDEGLTLILPGVDINTDGINSKFRREVEEQLAVETAA